MSAINEAAWELLDAMREADFAKGLEEQQYARQDVTQSVEKLRKALAALPPAMTWTTQRPSKPGWYWWKHGAVREVVHIKLSPAGFPNMERIGTDQYSPRYYDEGNEWCAMEPPQ